MENLQNNGEEEVEFLEHGEVLELVDENGKEIKFTYEANLELEGNEYVVLLPQEQSEESDEMEEEVVILRVVQGENGEDILESIEDEEEEEAVFQEFLKNYEEE